MYVTDAVGGRSQVAHRTGIERLAHAGAVPTTALAVDHRAVPRLGDARSPGRPVDVIYWYFSEVPKLTDDVGVAEAEKRRRGSLGSTLMSGQAGRQGLRRHRHRREHGTRDRPDVRPRGCVGRRLRRRGRARAKRRSRWSRRAGGEMVSLQPCRLSDPADCAELVELAVSEFGRIDVLFNLAGRSHFGRIEDVTDEEWDAARRDEVDLVFYLTRAAWPHLMASRGVVVNMASLNGRSASRASPRCRTRRTRRRSSG